MLSDEEKYAIDYLKIYIERDVMYENRHYKQIEIILNLIEKQSKEIAELSDKLTEKICKGVEEEILEEYRQTIISKDKEIEELKEDNKKYIDLHYVPYEQYTSKLNELNKKWEDKIKAKIEEYKEKCKNCNFRGKICEEFKQNYNCTIAMCLKEFYSLLEKE